MVFEPIEHVIGVVRGLVVTDQVALAARIAAGHLVEQLDEDLSAGLWGKEAERPAAPHVEGSHERQSPVADALFVILPVERAEALAVVGDEQHHAEWSREAIEEERRRVRVVHGGPR
jgi:hypothetical protein